MLVDHLEVSIINGPQSKPNYVSGHEGVCHKESGFLKMQLLFVKDNFLIFCEHYVKV